MRTMFLAAATVSALSFSVASNALARGALVARPPHPMKTAEITAQPKSSEANPTGIPPYLMQADGRMTNGLLPTNGWQG
jgi:hypothetical protein